jgi:type II secretory pathway pseudopilin PulG
MLVLLGLLGAIALATSSTEIRIAGQDRNAQSAVLTAEAAIEYAKTDPQIYLFTPLVGPVWTPAPLPAPALPGTITVGATRTANNVSVSFLAAGDPPVASGVEVGTFSANYFALVATGTGPNNSAVGLEAQIGKVVPKPGL